MDKTSFVIDMTKSVGSLQESHSTMDFYKRTFLNNVRELGLNIAGEDVLVRSGVDQAGFGNLLSIGTAPHADAEWIRRPEYAAEKGYSPVLNIIKDWKLINQKLVRYYEETRKMRLRSGAEVTFHDGFVKIGTELVTFKELGEILVKYYTHQ